MNVGRTLHEAVRTGGNDAMLIEYWLIIESLLHDAADSTAFNLKVHLIRARDRTLRPLKVFYALLDPNLADYCAGRFYP
ncbi:hypothetical protein SAMN05216409_10891 [Pseudomonas lutea]|uniref:Uncharacterized protein n=1 Tax=Pseudomonas lutea TaxID=243924 RepID=A0A9X8QK16_9PSED|nr:hypothetical protein SAMN05216409_10891 [Pseudomonas lutea]